MRSEPDAAGWHFIPGTARGATHFLRDMPNQDSIAHEAAIDLPATIVAVADGHGHFRHARSATGSALAVEVACRVGAQFAATLAATLAGDPAATEVAATVRDSLPPAIVGEWRTEVAKHLAAHPYTAQEQSALADAGDEPEVPYGSTLLFAVIAGGWLACAQIGDGDLLAVRPDGTALSPVPGDSRLDGQHTTSLCQPDAEDDFRTCALDLRADPLLALLLATDGYGNAQTAENWQPEVAGDLAALAATHDLDWFAAQVPSWAERCASADGSGDDVTIALLLSPDYAELATLARRERARLATAPPTARRVPTVPSTTPVPTVPSAASAPTVPSAAADPIAQSGGQLSGGPAPARSRPRSGAGHAGRGSARRRWIGVLVAVVVCGALAAVVTVLMTRPSPGHPAAPPAGRTQAPARKAASSPASPSQRGRQTKTTPAPSHGAASSPAPATDGPSSPAPASPVPTTAAPTTAAPATAAPTGPVSAGGAADGGQQQNQEGD